MLLLARVGRAAKLPLTIVPGQHHDAQTRGQGRAHARPQNTLSPGEGPLSCFQVQIAAVFPGSQDGIQCREGCTRGLQFFEPRPWTAQFLP